MLWDGRVEMEKPGRREVRTKNTLTSFDFGEAAISSMKVMLPTTGPNRNFGIDNPFRLFDGCLR